MLEKKIRIQSFDVFPNGTLKPSALMRHMQQIAREDCDGMGATYSFMRSLNTVFVLTRLAVEIYAPVRDGEELLLKTYNNSIHGVIFDREYELMSKGRIAAKATTLWTLVRYDTRSLVRPKDFPVRFEAVNLDITGIDIPRRFEETGLVPCGERIVRTSDLDENDHLNNCVYADIALDAIDEFDGLNETVGGIKIIFRHEARRGDKLLVSRREEDGRHIVFAHNETTDMPCFETEISFR